MNSSVLSIINVTKTFKDKKIIDNISFNIEPGEIVGLLGPNGAGKTTTMKMIMGLLSVDQGDIFINENNIISHRELCLSKVGGIIETPLFYPFLTGYENLRYFASLHGKTSSAHINRIISFLNLEHAKDKKVKTYSLGMKQRLGVAQALVHEPNLLILDEPMNGLDPHGIKDMRNYLKDLASKKNTAVLISSHIISEIELLCDRVIFMKNGKLINRGSTLELNHNIIEVVLSVNEPEKTLQLLKDDFELEFFNINNGDLKGKLNSDDFNKVLLTLIKNNIKILEFRRNKESLEDKFLQLTGGNIIG